MVTKLYEMFHASERSKGSVSTHTNAEPMNAFEMRLVEHDRDKTMISVLTFSFVPIKSKSSPN